MLKGQGLVQTLSVNAYKYQTPMYFDPLSAVQFRQTAPLIAGIAVGQLMTSQKIGIKCGK